MHAEIFSLQLKPFVFKPTFTSAIFPSDIFGVVHTMYLEGTKQNFREGDSVLECLTVGSPCLTVGSPTPPRLFSYDIVDIIGLLAKISIFHK